MSPETMAALSTWGPILVMIMIFYFLLYRPQKAAQKRRMNMLDSLKVGHKVMTIGGLFGTIEAIDDKVVKLKIAANTVIEVSRASINSNISLEEQQD
ncbi:MAG: preprotein translocase subunit YajC [Selenomonas sp.]|nr:preprotein translocase subunit YajC [Selenomonas sp.]MBQ1461958.1 preprotein translocase subunit YajC [Selenomonas sp.]MBQ1919784.1 preprotein translocase subunit YajC [Selenomonas sp.]MBQ2087917.1 preprotein translocase subunit YajC [Selenomonas sp.]MBQ5501471.1 preprotein translocase subunit YajC [Selenomonas sp.]